MSEELNLVTDLALILVSAGVFTVISKALKQPLILGYIVAGFIVGPYLGLFPKLTSMESVQQWSEIGIIFLLFSLGLEFSFKKLLKVGSGALITAGINCVGMFVIGMVAGSAMDWTTMESIFLGGMLSMSSTTIIIKAFDEMGLKKAPYSGHVFGVLVFEDLIAVLLMVLLTTMAVSNKFAGGEMALNLGKLGFFLILWFLVGIYVIPTVLQKARKYLTDEILLIIAVGLCFGMVALASLAGFSSALGAFVMGSILSETVEGEKISKLLGSIKDLFGAIFFVSVGMMVDPAVIGEHWGVILIIAVVTVVGKLCFSVAGTLLGGKGFDTAVHSGFSLAQLGEFSFIIAGLGISLGVMREFIYPVIISVSVLTTFTTPYLIKAADPALKWLYKVLPDKVLSRLTSDPAESENKSAAEQNEWKMLLKSYAVRIGLYGVVLLAIALGAHYLVDLAAKLLPGLSELLRNLIVTVATIAIMSPFLYGLAVSNGDINKHASKLLKEKNGNKYPLFALELLRIFIVQAFVIGEVVAHFELSGWMMFLLIVLTFGILLAIKLSARGTSFIESRFLANLNEREAELRRLKPVTSSVNDKLARYDVHIESVNVSPDFLYIGKALREMPFRRDSGVNIIKIERGSGHINIPSGDEPVYPGDVLYAVGTSEQLASFSEIVRENVRPQSDGAEENRFCVEPVEVRSGSYMHDKTLRELDMRNSGCMVISVLRGDAFTTNPKADFRIAEGDVVWIAGEKESCDWFIR